jgi:hypothetical protein
MRDRGTEWASDRERLLVYIAALAPDKQYNPGGYEMPHWAYVDTKDINPGEIVRCTTSIMRPHPWCVARFVEPLRDSMGGALLRELGGHRLCNMSNEGFQVLRGVSSPELLEGNQYKWYLRARNAIQFIYKRRHYTAVWGGIEFTSMTSNTATISIRKKLTQDRVSFVFEFKSNKTTRKQLVEAAMAVIPAEWVT